MAAPQFPMYSPESGGTGGSPVEPLFGSGPDSDPGYLATLQGPPTTLGMLRRTMAVLTAAPVVILALVPFIVHGGRGMFGPLTYWAFIPLAAGFVVAVVAGTRVPRPLTPGRSPAQSAAEAAMAFRQAVLLRYALSDGLVLVGLVLAIVTHGKWAFAAGFVLGFPLLVVLAVPTRGMVERMRRRLERDGAESHLWAVLLAPLGG